MRLVSISAIPLAEACSMNSAGDWAKALLAPRPSSIAKLAVRNRIRNTIRKVMMVVEVLMISCQVSL
jgi:hypothetical protein